MNVIRPTEAELARLPEGTQLVEFSPPDIPELAEVIPAVGAKLPTGQVMFFLAFEDHDEWKDFRKSRKLILLFPLGQVPIFSIGSMFVKPKTSCTECGGRNCDPSTCTSESHIPCSSCGNKKHEQIHKA